MITLDYADKRPLYEQTKEKLRELIISGALKPHERIPSVRELAAMLSINPNTIQKAYHELESEGYIYSRAAKGNYVCERESTQKFSTARANELFEVMRNTAHELKFLGKTKNEITEYLAKVFEEEEKDDD